MIREQRISVYRHEALVGVLIHERQKTAAIFVGEEDGLAVVAALRDM